MDRKHRALFLSAVFLPLASGVGALIALAWLLGRVDPAIFADGTTSLPEFVIGMAIILAVFLCGYLLGAVAIVMIWRAHVSRSTLEAIFTQPYIPVVSRSMAWLFRRIYPGRERGDDE